MGRRSQPGRQRCALLHRSEACGVCARNPRCGAVGANVRDNGAGAPCWQEQKGTRFIATFLVFAAWTAERAGLFRASVPQGSRLPPSWSRCAKPEMRVSMPCSRAQVSGIPSGERWDSVSDSACSMPSTKSALPLCLRGGRDDQLLVVLQFANPRSEDLPLSSRTATPLRMPASLERNAAPNSAISSSLEYRSRSELDRVGDTLPVQPRTMTGRMCHLVKESVIVAFRAMESGRRRDAVDIVARGVERGKAGVIDRAKLGFLDDGSGPIVR